MVHTNIDMHIVKSIVPSMNKNIQLTRSIYGKGKQLHPREGCEILLLIHVQDLLSLGMDKYESAKSTSNTQ